jgi:hypothetical protein
MDTVLTAHTDHTPRARGNHRRLNPVAAALDPGKAAAAAGQEWPPCVLVAGPPLIGLVAEEDGLFSAAGHRSWAASPVTGAYCPQGRSGWFGGYRGSEEWRLEQRRPTESNSDRAMALADAPDLVARSTRSRMRSCYCVQGALIAG